MASGARRPTAEGVQDGSPQGRAPQSAGHAPIKGYPSLYRSLRNISHNVPNAKCEATCQVLVYLALRNPPEVLNEGWEATLTTPCSPSELRLGDLQKIPK